MSEHRPEDKQFETYLKGQDRLSATYRSGSDEEPPAAMDRMILDASKKAVKKKIRIAYSPFSSSWAIPASITVILVLSISIVPLMQESEDISDLKQLSESYTPERQKIDRKLTMPEDKRPIDSQSASGARVPSSAISPKPAADDMGTMHKDTLELDAIQVKPVLKKKNRVVTGFSNMQPAVTEAEESIKEESRLRTTPAYKKQIINPADQTKTSKESPQPARRMEHKSMMDFVSKPQQPIGIMGTPGKILPPEEWIKKIQELHDAGKTEEAKASLEEFRKHYPDYPIDINLNN